jgi:hypothetical protein
MKKKSDRRLKNLQMSQINVHVSDKLIFQVNTSKIRDILHYMDHHALVGTQSKTTARSEDNTSDKIGVTKITHGATSMPLVNTPFQLYFSKTLSLTRLLTLQQLVKILVLAWELKTSQLIIS